MQHPCRWERVQPHEVKTFARRNTLSPGLWGRLWAPGSGLPGWCSVLSKCCGRCDVPDFNGRCSPNPPKANSHAASSAAAGAQSHARITNLLCSRRDTIQSQPPPPLQKPKVESWLWWHKPVVLALGILKQENRNRFNASLSYTVWG